MLDCCHCLMLKYRLHHMKSTKKDHAQTVTKACQGTWLKFCKMRPAAEATGMDMTMAAAAAFNSKAIQDRDCLSSQRQKGRRTKLPRNMKKTGTVSSPKNTRLVKYPWIISRRWKR